MTQPVEINGVIWGNTDELKHFMKQYIDLEISDANVLYYARKLGCMEHYKFHIMDKKRSEIGPEGQSEQ